ncbi:MAG: phosphatase PAP2 family protein [Anaerolineales bacterium]
MESILDWGLAVVSAVQGWGGWLEAPMKFFSFLGTEDFFMLVLPVLFWCVDVRLGIQVGFILLISATTNHAFKMAFQGPRPYWYSQSIRAYAAETSFGIPSGHAQTAASVWGMVAAGLKRGWAWAAAGALVFLIGLSRLYLGVHFPHDVLLGWLIGALLLWLMLRLWNPAAAWLKRLGPAGQILAGLLGSLILILPNVLIFAWRAPGFVLPQTWLENAAAARPGEALPLPYSLEGAVSNAGTLFGLAVGLVWLRQMGGFEMKAPAWKLVLRYLVGVAGVLVIRYGLKAVFPEGETLVAYLFRYLRYALIGAWVSGGAPWAFLRLRLATR